MIVISGLSLRKLIPIFWGIVPLSIIGVGCGKTSLIMFYKYYMNPSLDEDFYREYGGTLGMQILVVLTTLLFILAGLIPALLGIMTGIGLPYDILDNVMGLADEFMTTSGGVMGLIMFVFWDFLVMRSGLFNEDEMKEASTHYAICRSVSIILILFYMLHGSS